MQRHKTRAQQDPEHEQPEDEPGEGEQPAEQPEPAKEDVHEEVPPPTDEDPLANPVHKEGLSVLGTPKKPAPAGTKAESD